MINIQWDAFAYGQLNRFAAFKPYWQQYMHDELARQLSDKATTHIKPLLHARPWSTGKLADSLKPIITDNAEGFGVEFESLFYGTYMDNGNSNSSKWISGMMYASQFGYKAFPGTDGNDGHRVFMKKIRPMGSRTPGAPTHFSRQTLDWLANDGVASELLISNMSKFLESVVLR